VAGGLTRSRLVLADDERLEIAGGVGVAPPALQLPATAHDTELMAALPPWLRPAKAREVDVA
jgi:hypothetical protein